MVSYNGIFLHTAAHIIVNVLVWYQGKGSLNYGSRSRACGELIIFNGHYQALSQVLQLLLFDYIQYILIEILDRTITSIQNYIQCMQY